jgi:hypothetical protein
MWKKNMNFLEVAELIERFLEERSLYPQEWNDFVDTPQEDKNVEGFRLRCYHLDPSVNRPGIPDRGAIEELRSIVKTLRSNSG